MARGRKAIPKTFTERLEFIDAQILNHQNCINELKAQREEIVQQKKQADLLELQKVVTESGMTVEEIIALIQPSEELATVC